jgi:hypothetical protein
MLRSLYRLGFDWEALEYFAFVLEAVAGGSGDFNLQIMYGIDGRKDLTESTIDHLSVLLALRHTLGVGGRGLRLFKGRGGGWQDLPGSPPR